MAITMNGSGKVDLALSPRESFNSIPSYSFCSALLTTTASYAGNVIDFGVRLKEIHIINTGSHPIAFQFAEYIGTSKDSGYVPANDRIVIRSALKTGIALRSADASNHSTVVVFGV